MELTTGQSIFYSNKQNIPLEDVAESLIALKYIIEATPDVLERLCPGLHIRKVEVFVNEIKAGSLWQDLVVKFIWGNQERLDQEVEALRKDLKIDSIISNRALVGAIIGALIAGGGIYLLNKLKGSVEQKQTLQNTQNVFIVNGAELAGVTQEQFKAVIDGTISRNEHIPKAAVKVIRPAKRENDTTIVLNKDSSSGISNKAILAMPNQVPEDDGLEFVEDFQNVEIQIRATDLDSTKRGWAAVVPSVHTRRTKMHLDPHIMITDLLGKTSIKGEITIVFRYDDDGIRYPYLIFLRNILK